MALPGAVGQPPRDMCSEPALSLLQSEAQNEDHCCFSFSCILFCFLDEIIRKCHSCSEECLAQGRIGRQAHPAVQRLFEMRHQWEQSLHGFLETPDFGAVLLQDTFSHSPRLSNCCLCCASSAFCSALCLPPSVWVAGSRNPFVALVRTLTSWKQAWGLTSPVSSIARGRVSRTW